MRIVYVQYTNPGAYPPLEHSSRILASAGWKVLFLGTGALNADPLVFPPHPDVTVKQLGFCGAGLRQKFHYLVFGFWVLAWVMTWRPRWVYVSDPLSCPIALALSMIPGLQIVYHEHDSPDGVSDSWFYTAVLWCRRRLAARTTCCILPNQQRLTRFREEHPDATVYRVWNCPAREEIVPACTRVRGDEFWVVYHGSITPARLPLTVVQAVAMLPSELSLRVIGYPTIGHPHYLEELVEEAARLGVAGRLHVVGTLPTRKELLEWCTRSDVGLALLPLQASDLNELAMAGASNKPFDYLSQGVPVLVSDCEEWRSMFVVSGYGLACIPQDPCSIASALRWLFEHRKEAREMGERGRQRIVREWNYDTQFGPVYARLCEQSIRQSSTPWSPRYSRRFF